MNSVSFLMQLIFVLKTLMSKSEYMTKMALKRKKDEK